jgi:hypothetical protein
MKPPVRLLLLVSLLPLWNFAPAEAQDGDTIRQRFFIPLAPTLEVPARGRLVAPAISLGLPTGYGAGAGNASVGVGFQHRARNKNDPDGALYGSVGLGSSRETVGVEVLLLSYGTVNSCCRGGATMKLHRLLPYNSAVAVGAENLVVWRGGSQARAVSDVPRSYFGVASKVFRLRSQDEEPFSAFTLSLGAGDGRFGTPEDLRLGHDRWRPFGTASLRVIEPVSVLGEWTARDLSAGVSVTPLKHRPLIVTPAVVDLGTRPRFVVSAGYGVAYTPPF